MTVVTQGRASVMANSGMAIQGIAEGSRLRTQATPFGLPINAGFPDDLVSVETAPSALQLGNLSLRVVEPSDANLAELREEWLEWLEENEDGIGHDNFMVMANSDQSVPNLSSIMLLAEADGKTILFTGDGRSDHLLQGLDHAGLLNADGTFHVDVLKLFHHGSNRNVTKPFFKKVRADVYVASANGKNDNPDLATLIWTVEAAKAQDRQIRIVVTNKTLSTKKLLDEYPPAEYGYKLQILPTTKHAFEIVLSE